MNRFLLFIVWGSITHYVSSTVVVKDDVLLESISGHFYPDLIHNMKHLHDFGLTDSETNCSQKLQQFLNGLDNETRAAYFDSFGKVGAGILTGNVMYLGYYDQCIDIGNTDFCRFTFNVSLTNVTGAFTKSYNIPFEFGLCFPLSCSAEEFYRVLFIDSHGVNHSYTYSFNYGSSNYTIIVSMPTNAEPLCPVSDLKWTTSSIIILTLCVLFVVLVITGTIVDVFLWFINEVLPKVTLNGTEMKPPATATESCEVKSINETLPLINVNPKLTMKRSVAKTRCIEFLKDLILSFSLYKTLPAIMATHQPANAITSINGIRVISMFWVIFGHTFLWGLQRGVTENILEAIKTVPNRWFFQPVDNAFLSVDSFFVLSGLLLSYLSIREMDRRKGKFPFGFFYVHRLLRLSPAYYFAMLFDFKVLPYLGSGPLWFLPDINRCGKYWWTNILYINNFYPSEFQDQCFGVTWYLAVDMQFFIVSPIFLLLLYHFWKIGLATIVGTMLVSIAVIGTLAGIQNPNANLLIDTVTESGASLSDFAFSNIYQKPYCRINAYLIGIMLGFILHKKWRVKKNFWIRVFFYTAVWLIAAACSLTVAFGQYKTWNNHPFSKTENVLYFMFSRTGFSIGIAFMIYACHNGFGGIVNKFLSWSFWVPLSRLTFMAYLAHPIVLSIMYGTMQFRLIYTDNILVVLLLAAIILSYGLALAFAVFVEYPLANVESAVYKLAGLKRRK